MGASKAAEIIVVVCDAGPLIHLHELGCLGLLSDYPRVLVPESVWEEVALHRPLALNCEELALEKVRSSGPMSAELEALTRLLVLHCGERDALRIAQEQKAVLLLSDDTAARLAAQTLHLAVHGSMGILLRAVRRGQKSREEVISLLRKIPALSSLHIRRDLLDEIIQEVAKSRLRGSSR